MGAVRPRVVQQARRADRTLLFHLNPVHLVFFPGDNPLFVAVIHGISICPGVIKTVFIYAVRIVSLALNQLAPLVALVARHLVPGLAAHLAARRLAVAAREPLVLLRPLQAVVGRVVQAASCAHLVALGAVSVAALNNPLRLVVDRLEPRALLPRIRLAVRARAVPVDGQATYKAGPRVGMS